MQDQYDVIIIGGGPMGLACAIELQKAGLSHVILEKGVLVNSLYNFPANMTFFSTSKLLEIGGVPFISHRDKPTRSEALEYYRRVSEKWTLNLRLYEEVLEVKAGGGEFEVRTTKGLYKSRSVVAATGFYDLEVKMNVPGEALPKVSHYYKEAHPYVGQDVLVVGAANSACQVALDIWSKGANTTMLIRSGEIYRGVKYWIKPNIENRIKEGSIKAFFHARLLEIEEDRVLIETPEGKIHLPNDFVLAMTGYKPNYKFLRMLGIEIGDDEYSSPCYDPETLETNVRNLYLAGVVCGGLKTNRFFIENSRSHAEAIVGHMLTRFQEEVASGDEEIS
ncbi:MAG: YpdA family putative bacillithiol disulfide reductase [Saprospiraceae bacterium]|nr:YpdA family putative bacillithiol disulfide reductase [Saprospiraceae bacterium]